jgi:hypothetical protein
MCLFEMSCDCLNSLVQSVYISLVITQNAMRDLGDVVLYSLNSFIQRTTAAANLPGFILSATVGDKSL